MKARRESAFTLVEVILAIIIISGIMVVLLYFYQRAAETRENAMRETEYVSVARLVLEQITTELRTARLVEDQFIGLEGTSNSISFVCTSIPQVTRWIADTNETVALPASTDLKHVYYGLSGGAVISEVTGLLRSESLVLGQRPEPEPVDPFSDATPLPGSSSTNYLNPTNAVAAGPLLTDMIRFFQARYWNGTEWVDSWSGMELPVGVEVSVGREPMPAEIGEEGYPFELFRRTIYLPNSTHLENRVEVEPLEDEPL